VVKELEEGAMHRKKGDLNRHRCNMNGICLQEFKTNEEQIQ